MNTKLAATTLVLGICCAPLTIAQDGPADPGGPGICAQALVEHLEQLPVGDYDEQEVAAISYLREEEKLARDVYLMLSLHWETPIFTQIARSEQHHMDLVALLMARHTIADPVIDDTIGVFADPLIASLFDELTELGRQSLVNALTVGATIEDLDLADLAAIRADSGELDTWLVVENLAAGSRNHLRAFADALGVYGWVYEAQYLDPSVVADIVSSGPERATVYDEFGDLLAQCGVPGGFGDGTCSGTCGGNAGDGGGARNGGNESNGGNGGGTGNGDGSGTGDCDGSGPNGN